MKNQKTRELLFKELQPELLITMGGLIVSKKIKAFLREYKPKHHWHINNKKAYDTFFSLSKHIKTDENWFFENILGEEVMSYKVITYSIWNKVKHKISE